MSLIDYPRAAALLRDAPGKWITVRTDYWPTIDSLVTMWTAAVERRGYGRLPPLPIRSHFQWRRVSLGWGTKQAHLQLRYLPVITTIDPDGGHDYWEPEWMRFDDVPPPRESESVRRAILADLERRIIDA